MNNKNQNRTYIVILIGSVFAARIIMLFQSPWPNGLDGAYYAMEFRSFMERGHLENPDLSPLFRIGGLLSRLTGNPVATVKICSALLSAALTGGIYILLCVIKPESPSRAVFAAILTAISPSLAKLSVNYLNNLGGLAFGLLALSFAVLYLKSRKWHYLLPTLLFLLSAVLSHRVVAVYLFVIIICYLFQTLWKQGSKSVRNIVMLCILLLSILIISFKIEEYKRFKGTFSLIPLLPIMSSAFRNQLPLAVIIEMTLYFILCYALLFHSFIKNKRGPGIYTLVPLFFFPFWNLSNLDMGYRMFLSAIPGGAFFVAMVPMNIYKKNLPGWNILPWLALPFVFMTILVYPPRKDPPYEKYHEVVKTVELDDDSLLIAHLGLNHIYTYDKNFRDSLNYIPDFPVPSDKVWRLAYGAPLETITALFPTEAAKGKIRKLPYNYILIKEVLWQEYLEWEDEKQAESLQSWFNPYITRPAFIRQSYE